MIGPEPGLRRTGIRVIDRMPWGAHICVFYETKQDLLDICVSYFATGLENNEFCVWVVSMPITEDQAKKALRKRIISFNQHLAAGDIEIIQGREWYLRGDEFDLKRITSGWDEKLQWALANGFEGMRVSGDAFWLETEYWREFRTYEDELNRTLAGKKIIATCTYSLRAARALDLMDVARAHQVTVARRNGEWEFLETPELKQAKKEISRPSHAIDILSGAFPGNELLTLRERMTLAQIVKGASSKEAAQVLGISPRTVEFHRKNIMQKLDAKNAVALVRKVLDQQ